MSPSADLYARAVIAAAVSYGDPPLAWAAPRTKTDRRAASAAASGIARELGVTLNSTCRALGLLTESVQVARARKRPGFEKAEAAAREAVAYARGSARVRSIPLAVEAPELVLKAPAPSIVAQNRDIPRPKPQPGEQYRTGRRARAIPKSATFKSLGEGVQVIRLKPIDDKVLDRARRTIGPRCTLETFADLWDVDAEALQRALQPEVTA